MRDQQPSFASIFDDQELDVGPISPRPGPAALDDLFAQAPDDRVGGHVNDGQLLPRFDGDTSQLPAQVCWTLQHLVAAPHITEARAKKLWPVLMQHEDIVRSRLSELGLVLEINHERGFAFTRQADDPSPFSRTLLRSQKLSLAASTLLLYLYSQYLISPDEAVVETEDMVDHMLGYKPAGNTDEAGFRARTIAAIERLEKASIIKAIPGTGRYLIHGVITAILTADRVEALTARFHTLAAGQDPGRGGSSDDEPTPSTDDTWEQDRD